MVSQTGQSSETEFGGEIPPHQLNSARRQTASSDTDDSSNAPVSADNVGQTLLAWLRTRHPGLSWSDCRKLLTARRVSVNGVVEVHEARRLKLGDRIDVAATGSPPLRSRQIGILHADRDVVVVHKPPHIVTTRRPEERHWPAAKRQLSPTLDELTLEALGQPAARLWRVQRLDRETSGLVLFARTEAAARNLIEQFAARTVERAYLAVTKGVIDSQTVSTRLVRDRGDGLRGSSPDGRSGQIAVTHLRRLNHVGEIALLECRLETGRTHQIRIHLCELGAPVCGEPVYRHRLNEAVIVDDSGAPRLALHAAKLGFGHPRTGQWLVFNSTWPPDLTAWLQERYPALL